MSMKKVQITIEEKLLERVDSYADENYMTRSGLLSLAVTQLLNADDITKSIKDMSYCFRKIADNNNQLDDETLKKLQELELFCKMFSSN